MDKVLYDKVEKKVTECEACCILLECPIVPQVILTMGDQVEKGEQEWGALSSRLCDAVTKRLQRN